MNIRVPMGNPLMYWVSQALNGEMSCLFLRYAAYLGVKTRLRAKVKTEVDRYLDI
jgi:hypothetical protein